MSDENEIDEEQSIDQRVLPHHEHQYEDEQLEHAAREAMEQEMDIEPDHINDEEEEIKEGDNDEKTKRKRGPARTGRKRNVEYEHIHLTFNRYRSVVHI